MVKGVEFKFDVHVYRDTLDTTTYKNAKKKAWPESYDPLNSLGGYMHFLSAS